MSTNLTQYIKDSLNLLNRPLGKEYSYSCIPLAIIDAVYSIRQSYAQAEKAVHNYCTHYGIAIYKGDNGGLHTVTELIKCIEAVGADNFAKDILHFENKTAGGNKILKSQAVYEWAKVLKSYGIETFEDFNNADKDRLETELLKIQGQGDTVVKYFYMLCGNEDYCKPDKHILAFLEEFAGQPVDNATAQKMLTEATEELKADYPDMTVRLLDYNIWSYQKNKCNI